MGLISFGLKNSVQVATIVVHSVREELNGAVQTQHLEMIIGFLPRNRPKVAITLLGGKVSSVCAASSLGTADYCGLTVTKPILPVSQATYQSKILVFVYHLIFHNRSHSK